MRPVIGITTSYKENQQAVSWHYIRAIEQSGGLPVIAPMFTQADAAQQFARMLDGLVMTGGPGITQGLIGALPADLAPVDPVRDQSDRLIFEAFQARPVLGICYGMQFINAQAGGTILADLTAQEGDKHNHSASRGAHEHPIQITAGTRLHHILKVDTVQVNTEHIQAVKSVGAGLKVAAFSDDGVIEALESDDGRLLGVQFHPERMYEQMAPLFDDFVARCRR